MARKHRCLTPGAVVHVTNNIDRGQYLLTPSPEITAALLGVWRKCQARHGMKVLALVILSNHFHALLEPESQTQLSDFMHDVECGMYHVVRKLRGKPFGHFFAGRYAMTECLDDEAVLHDYRYILANSVAEGLVESPRHWPGAHSAEELCGGPAQLGRYFDKAAYTAAKAADRNAKRDDFQVEAPVELTPIPAHRSLSRHQQQTANRRLVQDIVREYAALRTRPVAGAAAILAQDPLTIPDQVKVSRLARFKARGILARELIEAARAAYRAMVEAYYAAWDAFCAGRVDATFPPTAYLPRVVRIARGKAIGCEAHP